MVYFYRHIGILLQTQWYISTSGIVLQNRFYQQQIGLAERPLTVDQLGTVGTGCILRVRRCLIRQNTKYLARQNVRQYFEFSSISSIAARLRSLDCK